MGGWLSLYFVKSIGYSPVVLYTEPYENRVWTIIVISDSANKNNDKFFAKEALNKK